MERYGVIDIGSNTIRLVLYKWEKPVLTAMLNKKRPAGLANYIEDGRLTHDGIARAVQTLEEFREAIEITDIKRVFVFATASLRNISNTEQAVAEIERGSGFSIRVLSGREEAVYDYLGAIRALPVHDGLVVDVGGGSTELVPFRARQIITAESLPIGSLNLFTKYVHGIIPHKRELERIKKCVQEELAHSKLLEAAPLPGTMLAVGGTARAVLDLIRARFPDDLIDGLAYPAKTLRRLLDLFRDDRAAFERLVLRIASDRVHTIVPGLMVIAGVAGCSGAEQVLTSPYGVREGYLFAQLTGGAVQ